ncbi:MAG TPA: site-2 protease family protein [Egibacteraceae bacterium]|nr:site-2 protease family protein [Egibacteraceae bacterium]
MRVLGVPVRVDGSLLLIAGLVAWFYADVFGGRPGAPAGAALGVGAALAAAGFVLSLLAHELGHAVTSRAMGIPVHGITLFLMGGVTESAEEAKRPRDDFLIVALGPVLSGLAGLLAFAVARLDPPQPLDSVAVFLAWANWVLAVFNLVPGYPLDGGRLLRAVLWGVTGRPHAATRWAARIGQGFAGLLGAYGLWALTQGAGGLGGLWEIFIAVFLWRGAAQSHARAGARERLAAKTVRDVMGSVPPSLDPSWSLAEALERIQEKPSLLWPVGDPVIGGLTLAEVDAVEDLRWHDVTVGDAALRGDSALVAADAGLEEALRRMRDAPHTMLVVVEDGRAVGLLTPSLLGFGDE